MDIYDLPIVSVHQGVGTVSRDGISLLKSQIVWKPPFPAVDSFECCVTARLSFQTCLVIVRITSSQEVGTVVSVATPHQWVEVQRV